MPITALPTPPSRAADTREQFQTKSDALLGALPTFVGEANTLEANVNAKEASTVAAAAAAAASEAKALEYRDVALTAINAPAANATCTAISTSAGGANSSIATVVAAGTLYATLQTGKSLQAGHFVNFADAAGTPSYIGTRCVSYDSGTGVYVGAVLFSEGSGTYTLWNAVLMTDPTKIVPRMSPYATAGDYACIPSGFYIITGDHDGTLPATPEVGQGVTFKNKSGLTNVLILRNGKLIEGVAEDMTIDVLGVEFSLVYTGATYGWMVL
jgi:hypothetical protein